MLAKVKAGLANGARATGKSIITWSWTKKVVHWLIISAGTMSELVFLVASLWVSVNANVHKFILLFLSEGTTQHLTELATTAYVALPECIVGLACMVTIGHLRVWMYKKSDLRSLVWIILFGLPTIVFLVLSLVTLGNAVANVNFQMPTFFVIIRAEAGYIFAFASLLYTGLGQPQEKDRLEKKDSEYRILQAETSNKIVELEREINKLASIIDQQKQELQKAKRQHETLQTTINKTADDGLEAYSQECKNWLKSDVKSANIETIMRYTGHSKTKINNALKAGKLETTTRNKELITIASLLEWLRNNSPQPTQSIKIVQLNQVKNEMDTDELEAIRG